MQTIVSPPKRRQAPALRPWQAAAAALAGAILLSSRLNAQTATTFPGPIWIQPQEPAAAALQIDRINGQPAALDIFSHGGGNEIRFFSPDPFKGQVLRSYIDYNGAFHTNAWLVISGELSDDRSPTPTDLYPTSDPFMLGIWSDVEGPAVVIRPTMTSAPDPPFATMDGDGNYRFSILADGSLNFAAPESNTFGSTHWDTVLHRVAPAELRTEGEFSAVSIGDTPLEISMTNTSGAPVAPGTVLKIDPAHDRSFLPTTSQDDPAIAGVAAAPIAAGTSGPVLIRGVGQVQVVGFVARGSILVSSSSPGLARIMQLGEVPPPGAVIGKALTMSQSFTGTVTALVNP